MSLYDRPTTAVVDIDGVIATGTKEKVYSDKASWAYDECDPISSGIEMVNRLKEKGIRVILQTARFEEDRFKTEIWLKSKGVAYDELIMGKPQAEIYIDDKGLRYLPDKTTVDEIMGRIIKSRFAEFEEELYL